MASVLITGCSGFLASYLIETLKQQPENRIYGITEIENFSFPGCAVSRVDIRDRDRVISVLEATKPDWIFHLAAVSNVGFSWKYQKQTYEVNVIGSSNLIEAASMCCPSSRIILMSSAELYGSRTRKGIRENEPVIIQNPYALSKWAMEMVGNMYIGSRGMDIIKVRSFNFTGPGQARDFVCSDFAFQIASIEAGLMEPELRVGNLSAVRDISDVRDITRYLCTLVEQGESGGIYNLCSGRGHSIQEILDRLLSMTAAEIRVTVDPEKFRPVDNPVLRGDCTLIRTRFGLVPRFGLDQTLADILAYWRTNLK